MKSKDAECTEVRLLMSTLLSGFFRDGWRLQLGYALLDALMDSTELK